jgi:hypothetical protein
MRKLLITTVLGLIPACGCSDCLETLRRVEVWKAQNYFTPREPVTITPASCNPCGAPAAPAAGCSCQQGATAGTVVSSPAVMPGPDAIPDAVSAGYPTGTDEPVSTEEFNGVLKQP